MVPRPITVIEVKVNGTEKEFHGFMRNYAKYLKREDFYYVITSVSCETFEVGSVIDSKGEIVSREWSKNLFEITVHFTVFKELYGDFIEQANLDELRILIPTRT
jgi:hypothetical protein